MSIERIVRPFQDRDQFRARVLPPTQALEAQEVEPVVVTISSRADTEYVDEPPPVALGFNAEWVEDIDRRVTDTVRVENPDDASQFVEIERIRTMVLKNTQSGEEIPIKPQWD